MNKLRELRKKLFIFSSVIVIFSVVFVWLIIQAGKPVGCDDKDIYRKFAEYRRSLNSVIDNPAVYFSEDFVREELNSILNSSEFDVINNARVTKKLLIFGSSIKAVFSADVSCGKGMCRLDLAFQDDRNNDSLRRTVVIYKCDSQQRPLINSIEIYVGDIVNSGLRPIEIFAE